MKRWCELMYKVGSLFWGIGSLDRAVCDYFGGEVVWLSDIDKAACKVAEARMPGVPNLGDVSKVDFAEVEPIDILVGGFPCQDLSHAGKREGLHKGRTRSGLWGEMLRAITTLHPKFIVVENVRGLLNAEAGREDGRRPLGELGGRLGIRKSGTRRGQPEPELRALGRVLGDLAEVGYDARWCGLPASDIGACHQRFRVFLVAHPRRGGASNPDHTGPQGQCGEDGAAQAGGYEHPQSRLDGDAGRLLPTPDASPHKYRLNGPGTQATKCLPAMARRGEFLPTPVVNDMGAGKEVDKWDTWTEDMRAKHGNGNGHGRSLSVETRRLDHAEGVNWGKYEAAVRRAEEATGVTAPPPTTPHPKDGRPRLNERFVEWMMMVPEGFVTDLDLTWAQKLKLFGNSVVAPQAYRALELMLGEKE